MEDIVDFSTLHAPIPLRENTNMDSDDAKQASTRQLMKSLEASAEGLAITEAAREHFQELMQNQTKVPMKQKKAACSVDSHDGSNSSDEEDTVVSLQSEFQPPPETSTPSVAPVANEDSSSEEEDLIAAIKRK
jgi:hypothetical protein